MIWEQALAGRCALVTGGGRRIGRAIALRLAEAGADVAITYRTSEGEAAAVVRDIRAMGRRGFAVACDVRDEHSVSAAVEAAKERMSGLNILVNNAGVFESGALEDLSAGQWDAMFAVNTRGPFLVARAALPHLRVAQGRIVNIGSLGAMQSWETHGHYCASKAALHSLSKTMAKAWAPDVSVNCVAPGMIVAEKEAADDVDSTYERFAQRTPMRRNGTVADVAEAVLFFAAGPAFVTGQMLAVDGGLGL